MNTNDFDFELPEHLIAQTPMEKRSESRLLVVDGDTLADEHFFDIKTHFKQGDVLVLNDTRVISARLFGTKPETAGF